MQAGLRAGVLGMALCVALTACSTAAMMTGYNPGAVSARQEPDGTWLIMAGGNGFTPLQAAVDYTYLKAAETVQAAGHTCFEVVSQQTEMARADMANGYFIDTHLYPVARLRIRMLAGVMDCSENNVNTLIERLRPRVADRQFYGKIKK